MPKKVSAGVLMYRRAEEPDGSPRFEVLLVHPGGPFFGQEGRRRVEHPQGRGRARRGRRGGVDLLAVALREVREETGLEPPGPFQPLGGVKAHQHKIVYAWGDEMIATRGDRQQYLRAGVAAALGDDGEFPEVDRAAFFDRGRPRSDRAGAAPLRRRAAGDPRRSWHVGRGRPLTAQTIVILTSSGHTVTMETVSVAQLKARLSEYLRRVEAGERFLILNRRGMVGVLAPYDAEEDDLVIRQPEPGTPTLGELKFGPPLNLGFDVVDISARGPQGPTVIGLHRFVRRSARAPGPGRLSCVMAAPDGGCLVGAHRGGVPARRGQASSQRRARPGGCAEASSRRVPGSEEPGDRPDLSRHPRACRGAVAGAAQHARRSASGDGARSAPSPQAAP